MHDPADLWTTLKDWLSRWANVFVKDLLRPDTPEEAAATVEAYAADEPDVLRRDFYHSLLAAYRPEELAAQLDAADLDLGAGRWECQLDGERVAIAMSQADSQRYLAACAQADHKPEGQYLMNGIYLPALLHVLNNADRDVETYSGRRWFAFLDQRLEAVGCELLGSKSADRLVDAQKVLESPFAKMPLIACAGDS